MLPAPTICRRAHLARDSRFDGRFIVGVVTTGVFCRPVCPARPPAEENVRYFATAAAALQAGYRPCLRCRPERANAIPAWTIGSETVIRALKLIDDGFLSARAAKDLAAHVDISERHLSRLFLDQLGATPKALARMHRIALAKRLLDDTKLAMTDVALSAGYGSVRRFNDEFRRVFGRSPRALRRGGAGADMDVGVDTVCLHLPVRKPYNADWVFGFLARRALPGLELVDGHTYRRRIGDHWVAVELSAGLHGNALRLLVPAPLIGATAGILARVRRMFDLDADPAAIDSHLRGQRELARGVSAARGIRVPGVWDGFEGAVKAILGQQVSVDRSIVLATKLIDAFGEQGFPTPSALVDADVSQIGIPGTRGAAVRHLAREVLDRGDVFFLDAERSREVLLRIAGIGPWTAEYVSMRVSRDPDAFPASDWVIKKVLDATARQAQLAAEPWRPWRAYAVMYLWYASGVMRSDAGLMKKGG